ncbi:hypothetical protein N7461_005459 [Penicillium sp. DV-2018c]|nr:hypothetical protein N7461_005459 [Penicillium sp. DV-2018c]
MSDNNTHHPGVRSLLAKFEGQSPITSPPSRGRSPAASDTSGTTRQLSKVRASFVTVDGVIQSNPASPLRKTSGRSDSPGIFGPKINSGDVDSGRQTTVSPTPASRSDHTQNATLAQIMAESRPNTETKAEPNHSGAKPTTSQPRDTSPKQTENPSADAKSTNSGVSSHKSDSPGTIKKKPSVGSTRNAASKHVPATAASAAAKPAASTTESKPTAREVAKERSNALAHKPSRVSLAAKPTARSTRGSTPAQDTSKPSTAAATNKPGTKSPPKTTRAPTQTSSARLGSASASGARTTSNTSTLTRKPSTLKSATGGQQRATTPSASVRRQSSRPSLPAQATGDSTTTKPVNEGFLARMMRPTASSANKFQSQEKTDAKPVSKTASASKAPRPSLGKVPERAASQAKPKSNTLRPQSQKSQPVRKEPASQKEGPRASEKRQESEKENIVEVEGTPAGLEEPAAEKSSPVVAVAQPEPASEPVEEAIAPAPVEEPASESAVASIEPKEKSIEVPEPIVEETVAEKSPEPVPVEDVTEASMHTEQIVANEPPVESKAGADAPAEASAEPVAEPIEEEKTAEITTAIEDAAAEPVSTLNQTTVNEVDISEKDDISTPEPQVVDNPEGTETQTEAAENDDDVPLKEAVVPGDKAETAEEKPSVVESTRPTATVADSPTEAESSNVAIDIANLALN